jgi:hypothetical protein
MKARLKMGITQSSNSRRNASLQPQRGRQYVPLQRWYLPKSARHICFLSSAAECALCDENPGGYTENLYSSDRCLIIRSKLVTELFHFSFVFSASVPSEVVVSSV